MAKISSRDHRAVQAHLAARKPFQTYGAFSAQRGHRGAGMLRGADFDRWYADSSSIAYSVYSYDTPIAWETIDGQVYKVAQRFSVTTSNHQGKLYGL